MKLKALSSLLVFCAGLCLPVRADEKSSPATPETADAAKKELPNYVRIAEDKESTRLEVAAKTFLLPGGQTVELLGVVHIADAAYYDLLDKRFTGFDTVLYELVGDPARVTAPVETRHEPSGLGKLQGMMSRGLDLVFQLDCIDYTQPNMVHCDATGEEFAKMQAERGESMMQLIVRSMQVQLNGQLDVEMGDLQKELDLGGLLRIFLSKDSASEFKIILARMFDKAESMTAKLEGEGGSAILADRNALVVKKLKETLKDAARKKISIFYGAAHMPGIEAALLKELKAERGAEEWLTAWKMRPPLVKADAPTAEDATSKSEKTEKAP